MGVTIRGMGLACLMAGMLVGCTGTMAAPVAEEGANGQDAALVSGDVQTLTGTLSATRTSIRRRGLRIEGDGVLTATLAWRSPTAKFALRLTQGRRTVASGTADGPVTQKIVRDVKAGEYYTVETQALVGRDSYVLTLALDGADGPLPAEPDSGVSDPGPTPDPTPSPTPGESCGNGICASAESCSSCAADCGVCPSNDTTYGPRSTPGLTSTALTMAASGWSTSANGQVVENMDFRSQISIKHANVTFRNCRFSSTSQWAWHPADFDTTATAGARFEHCDFVDALPAFGSADPARPLTVSACRFRGTSNGYGDTIKAGSNFVIEDSLLRYEYTATPDSHSDGIQSDVGSVANIVVRHNQIEVVLPGTANGCLFENEGGPEMGNWLIENNILKTDGGYAVRAPNLNGWGRVTVRNNQIPSTYLYGPLNTNRDDLVDWSGNVDENGKAIGR